MKAVLVAYASNSGSTTEVANAVGETMAREGVRVEVRAISELNGADLSGYDAVVVGAPMILGWHRSAERFLKAHQGVLTKLPIAIFATALSLTKAEAPATLNLPVFVDPRLAKSPLNPQRLALKERYATVGNYLRPILKSAGKVKPVSIAFFGGKLDFGRLKFPQMLFVMLVVGAQPGDYRNWDAIRAWASELPGKFWGN